jgi:hypothetical protein
VDDKVDLKEKLASFDEAFRPKIVGYYNDSDAGGELTVSEEEI